MNKRILLTVLAALAILGAIFGYKYVQLQRSKAALAGRKPVPATVTTAQAQQDQWRSTIHAVGTLESHQGIVLRSEIEGRILAVAFDSGQTVQAGDLLVEMDVAAETAELSSGEARAKLAELNLERARGLRGSNANTQADLDAAEASHAEARAAVESTRATLAKKRIVAPFAGRLGIRQVNVGQFLNKGDTVVGLESIDPIYADFTVPQQEVTLLKPGLEVVVSIDAFPDRTFRGKIEAIDPRLSDSTRSLRVRAALPNANEELRPGMFARVEVQLPEVRDLVVLPSTSIVYSPYGDSVYVVAKNDQGALVAQQRFVKVGPRRGDLISVHEGVKAGEEVVTSGQGKLRPGVAVSINNTVIPTSDAAPKPVES